VVAFVALAVLSRRTYRLLPESRRPAHFQIAALHKVRGFAGGMFLGALLGFLLMQADKLIISKMLPLEQLGYYTVAATAASGLLQLITPMNTAVFPRLTELVARNDTIALAGTYLRSCEWMAAVIVPPALLLVFFAEPTLLLWTGDLVLSHSIAPLLSMLALGTLLSGFMNLPYMLQLATGWTSLSVKINLVAVCAVVPGIVWAVPRYGAIGAACAWVALNAGYVLVGAHLMHSRLLPNAKWTWYRTAVAIPLAAGGATAALLLQSFPVPSSRSSAALILSCTAVALFVAVWSVLPTVRVTIVRLFHRASSPIR
jgi:O-antigen/teichoic acid export membrane protein